MLLILSFASSVSQAEKKTPAFCNLSRAVAAKGVVAVHVDTFRGDDWR